MACAVLIPLGLIGYAAFALKTGRAPAWLQNAASSTSDRFSSLVSRKPAYSNIGTATSASTYGGYNYSAGSSSTSAASAPFASGSYGT